MNVIKLASCLIILVFCFMCCCSLCCQKKQKFTPIKNGKVEEISEPIS